MSSTRRGERLDVRRPLDDRRGRRAATGPPSRRRTPSPRGRRSPGRRAPSCQPTVVSRPFAEARGCRAGVQEQERAGPVGVLRLARARSTPGRTSPPAGRRRARRSGSGGRRAPAPVSPKTPDVGRTSGRTAARHADEREQLVVPGEPVDVEEQRPAGVRDVGRVDGAGAAVPPVSRQSRNVSTVPKASSPRSARERAPGTASRMCAIFGPLKYASRGSPVRSRNSGLVAGERAAARTPAP